MRFQLIALLALATSAVALNAREAEPLEVGDLVKRPSGPSPGTDNHKMARSPEEVEDLVKRPSGPSPGTDNHKMARSPEEVEDLVKRPSGPSPGTDNHKMARSEEDLAERGEDDVEKRSQSGNSNCCDNHKRARGDSESPAKRHALAIRAAVDDDA